jgi:hypothetical protein
MGSVLAAGLLTGVLTGSVEGADAGDDLATASATTSAARPPAGFVPPGRRSLGEGRGPGRMVFTGVRVSDHDGFDRVVFRFRGRGLPGWAVEHVRRARLEGSGRSVRLGGEAVLQVFSSGQTWPARGYYSGPRRLDPSTDGRLAEVYVAGTFEGSTQFFLGVDDGPAPFRVTRRSSPPRLVVDVADRG